MWNVWWWKVSRILVKEVSGFFLNSNKGNKSEMNSFLEGFVVSINSFNVFSSDCLLIKDVVVFYTYVELIGSRISFSMKSIG